MESLEEFKKRIKKVSGPRNHKIKNSYGSADYFKYYVKNKPKGAKYVLNSKTYLSILREVNSLLADKLLSEGYIDFPLGIGSIKIVTYDNKPKIVNGKLRYIATVDWKKTHQLWYEDKEAFANRTVVKVAPGDIYRFRLKKGRVHFKNCGVYEFTVTRALRIALKNKVLNKETIIAFTEKR